MKKGDIYAYYYGKGDRITFTGEVAFELFGLAVL
jgi:hypothetical protein